MYEIKYFYTLYLVFNLIEDTSICKKPKVAPRGYFQGYKNTDCNEKHFVLSQSDMLCCNIDFLSLITQTQF